MGKRQAEDILPARMLRRSLAGRLSRTQRVNRDTVIDSSSAPQVGRGTDVSGTAIESAASGRVAVAISEAGHELATMGELHELVQERDWARERARAYRTDAAEVRQVLADLTARHDALAAEESARTDVFLEVRSQLAETKAALEGQRAEHASEVRDLQRQLSVAQQSSSGAARLSSVQQGHGEISALKATLRAQAADASAATVAMGHSEEARHRLSVEVARWSDEARTACEALLVQTERHDAELRGQEAQLNSQLASLREELEVVREAQGVSPELVMELRAELAAVWADKHDLETAAAAATAAHVALEKQAETLRQQVHHLAQVRDDERRAAAAELNSMQRSVWEVQEEVETLREELTAASSEPLTAEAQNANSKLTVYLQEAEAKLAASEARRRSETARVEGLERELAHARNAASDAEGGRRVAAQRAGEQKALLAQLTRDNVALRGLVEVSREVCGAPGLGAKALRELLPKTQQRLRHALEVAQAEVASREDRIRELEIAHARDAHSMPAPRRSDPSESTEGTLGDKLLARLRDITQDAGASA